MIISDNRFCNFIWIKNFEKVYKNIETRKGYKENDTLGGYENYSASKASCEILFRSYFASYFKKNNYVKILDSKKIYNTSNIDSISVDEVYDLI